MPSSETTDLGEEPTTGDSDVDPAFREVLREVARADSRTPPVFLAAGTRLGHYRLVDVLGRGGMGVVYRATDDRLGREVALKVLRSSVDGDERRRRFMREARSAAAINHPNVATIYEVGEADDLVYLAMELIDGSTLRVRLMSGPLGTEEGTRIVREIARGLAPAHAKGIVHRDLKPENVMVTSTGAIKVLDFGLAKLRAPSEGLGASLANRETETRDGAVLGTPAYMAPEQAMGGATDVRADIFAIGVMLYELITGVRPGLLGAGPVIEDEKIDAIVRRAVASKPEHRFADATELLASIDELWSVPPPSTRRSGVSWQPTAHSRERIASTEPTPDAFSKAPLGDSQSPRPAARRLRVAAIGAGLLAVIGAIAFARMPSKPVAADPVAPVPAVAERLPIYAERRLTAYSTESPVFALGVSPDGRQYAYANTDSLRVASLDESSRRMPPTKVPLPVTEVGSPSEIQFFPDGRRILVGDFYSQDGQTWILSLDGQPPQRARDAIYFALSPDGTRLAFRQSDDIVVGDVMGGKTTYIESTHSRGEVGISWSPDGTRLAISRAVDTTTRVIEIARADGSSRKTLATSVGVFEVTTPTWTANDRLAFESPRSGDRTEIVELTVDTHDNVVGPERRVWARPVGDLVALQYRNGRYFYIRTESQRDVYVGRLDAKGRKLEKTLSRFTLNDKDDTFVGWQPDGRIAYSSERDGPPRVYVSTLDATRAPSALVDQTLFPFAANSTGILAYRQGLDGGDGAFALIGVDGAMHDLAADLPVDVQNGRIMSCLRCSSKDPVRCVVGVRDRAEDVALDPRPRNGQAQSSVCSRRRRPSRGLLAIA